MVGEAVEEAVVLAVAVCETVGEMVAVGDGVTEPQSVVSVDWLE